MSAIAVDFQGGMNPERATVSERVQTRDLDGAYCPEYPAEGWESLVWDSYPNAGKDAKPSRGSGQSPDDRGFAACLSSLDSLENNRHTYRKPVSLEELYQEYVTEKQNNTLSHMRRPIGRGKFCGRCSVKGVDPATGRTVYRRINCGSWTCSYCGPRRARTARAAIRNVAEGLGLRYFLTLTLDPKKLEHPKFAVPQLRLCFNKFREYLRRKYNEPPAYISVLEFTKAGVPHLHILFDRYIDQRWISNTWDSLGGGRIVFIKRVTIQKVSRYLSKYLTKEMLLSAPKCSRRITAARSIKLFPKFQSGIQWELLQSSIWHMLAHCRMRDWTQQVNLYEFISIEMDEEDYLKAFQLHNVWEDKGKKQLCAV